MNVVSVEIGHVPSIGSTPGMTSEDVCAFFFQATKAV